MSELTRFADELAKIRDRVDQVRFRSSDRYVEEMDTLRRELSDLTERMRAAASRGKPADDPRAMAEAIFKNPAPLPSSNRPSRRIVTTDSGRRVQVERRRRSAA